MVTRQDTRTERLTLADLARTQRDARHLGFGYAISAHLPRQTMLRLDIMVVAVANDLGLDYEALFHWTNSKWGRWLVDELSGPAPLLPDETTVRAFLNAHTVAEARP